jgi:hypothetical protein
MTKKSAADLTNAARAEAVFKSLPPTAKPLNEHALEKNAFDDNRARLKAERLSREALDRADKAGDQDA